VNSKGVVRDAFYVRGWVWESVEKASFLEGYQARPARPYRRSSVEIKNVDEDVKMLTVVA
jgi:hypothetical protein